mmetsp:Transcript_48887/g.72634  ORF Transcript_48887/g.72634 Transcript_48887/m.72634 type:complete len:151 (+) Transcript_48887:141-593(+)
MIKKFSNRILPILAATILLLALGKTTTAFAPTIAFTKTSFTPPSPSTFAGEQRKTSTRILQNQPCSLQTQRKSVGTVTTMGLFGLGGPEIAIILIVGAFVLGPEKLASLGRDAGKMAGELKEVPKEFQKGIEEGEAEARAIKAKSMEKEP